MSLTFQPMMESRPIREIAYEVLKKAIITGEIPAGERIVETDYADRLHISRRWAISSGVAFSMISGRVRSSRQFRMV